MARAVAAHRSEDRQARITRAPWNAGTEEQFSDSKLEEDCTKDIKINPEIYRLTDGTRDHQGERLVTGTEMDYGP